MGSPQVVLYIRVSSDEQAKSGYSVPDQRRALREHAAREGYEVVEEVVDDGYSGGDPHRPGLRRVLEMAASGSLDLVLATKRDRFFRSRLYRLLTEQDLKEMDVRMVSMNDTGNRLADGFQDDFAEYEREMIKERTRAGLAQKVRSGKVIPGRKPPYGFRYAGEAGERLEPHEPEMAVVRRVLDAYAGGRGAGTSRPGWSATAYRPPPAGRSGRRRRSATSPGVACTGSATRGRWRRS